eukprot:6778993-Prymnesium_polylepis.1
MGPRLLRTRLARLTREVAEHRGTRLVVVSGEGGPEESRLHSLGWKLVRRVITGRPRYTDGSNWAQRERAASFWAC